MEKNKWIKMSEQQPQIDDWYTHYYVGVNKHGVLVIFTGMADVSGEPIEKRTKDCKWETVQENHLFDFLHNEYRIKPTLWRAEEGERYYFVTSDCSVAETKEDNIPEDDNHYNVGNYFATYEEAQGVADIIRIYLSKCHTKNEN